MYDNKLHGVWDSLIGAAGSYAVKSTEAKSAKAIAESQARIAEAQAASRVTTSPLLYVGIGVGVIGVGAILYFALRK